MYMLLPIIIIHENNINFTIKLDSVANDTSSLILNSHYKDNESFI